jgi:hypothetical protein
LVQQHRDRHGTDAARHWCEEAGSLYRLVEGHVADVALVVASVNDHGPGLDPAAPHEPRPTHGGHDHVRIADDVGQLPGMRVAVRDRGVAGEKQHSHGLAQDRAAADDDRAFAVEVNPVGVEQPDDPGWSAGCETRHPKGH